MQDKSSHLQRKKLRKKPKNQDDLFLIHIGIPYGNNRNDPSYLLDYTLDETIYYSSTITIIFIHSFINRLNN